MRIPPRRLLMVWAHPDDEAYLAAGLAGRAIDAGGDVRCVTVTHGEGGFASDDPRPMTERRSLRRAELERSLASVGVHDLEILGFADGACAQADEETAVTAIAKEIDAYEPDVVVTFEPQGVTLHPDHCAVSRWTTRAWARVGIGELLYATHTTGYADEFGDMNAELGVYIGDRRPTPTPDHEIAVDLNLSDREVERKRRALAAHASQTDAIAALMGEDRYRDWWRREWFRLPRAYERAAASAGHPSRSAV